MKLNYKVFNTMNSPDFSAASQVRKIVFIDEQKFSYDLDDTDKIAFHALVCDDDKPIATGRFFFDKNNIPHIGRVAVLKEYRKSGVGRYLMEILEKTAAEQGAKYITLGAQMRAADFYSRLGYTTYGEPYFEEYCEHINMKKYL